MNFDADVAQLIQLVTHSIYSNTDIFLRELISNANDACQKARLLSLQDTDYLGDETELGITIDVDTEKKTITLSDTWIGMSREEVIANIGTIAKSWTKAFLENLKASAKEKDDNASTDLIGQFGIGFYSAFMVADKVTLETKAKDHDPVLRTSAGDGSYELNDSTKTTRGTTITLYLKEEDDNQAYADHYRLRWLIKQHSNYVPVPIQMLKIEEGKPTDTYETINQMQSLWTKQKATIKQEEYDEFYKSLTYSQEGPLDTIHIHIEWAVNFKALLYIPKSPSMFESMMWWGDNDKEYGPSLYVQNVLIIEKAKELLPVWLRFVKGVVETPDLSLNVSREILQSNAVLAKIQKKLVKEVLKSLAYISKNNAEDYAGFYDHFARYLKEWVYYEQEQKEEVAGLLRYSSLLKDDMTSLSSFVETLPDVAEIIAPDDWEKKDDEETNEDAPDKAPLYYLLGKSTVELQQSPYVEQFRQNKTDVLLMADPLDEYVVQALSSYKGHGLKNASSPDIHLWDEKEIEEKKKETEKKSEENKDFLTGFVKLIGDEKIEKAEFTHKIGDNLAVLVTPEGQVSPQMERMMKAMNQPVPPIKRILQINPDHPLVAEQLNSKKADEHFMKYVYEQAFLLEGGELEDMASFVKRVNSLISK